MGALAAQDMAEQTSGLPGGQRVAITWHLTANHYPPLPTEYIGLLETAVEYCATDDGDAIVYLPADLPCHPRTAVRGEDGTYHVTATDLVEATHAWPFVEARMQDTEED